MVIEFIHTLSFDPVIDFESLLIFIHIEIIVVSIIIHLYFCWNQRWIWVGVIWRITGGGEIIIIISIIRLLIVVELIVIPIVVWSALLLLLLLLERIVIWVIIIRIVSSIMSAVGFLGMRFLMGLNQTT